MARTDIHQDRCSGKLFLVALVQYSVAMVRTIIVSFLLIGIILILTTCLSQAREEAKVQSPNPPALPSASLKTIIVGDYYPYTFVNDKGIPDGFSVDIAKAVAGAMNLKLEIREDAWENAIKALANGAIDFLPMMAASPGRDKYFDFSVPHTIANDGIFVRTETPKISSLKDLVNKTVIVMNKDAAHDYLLLSGMATRMKLVLVDSLPDALRTLAAGKGDAALMPKLVGLIVMKKLHLTNLNPSPSVIDTYNRPFSLAVKDGNQYLLEGLSQGLSIIKTTGKYQEIYKKWFGTLEPPGLSMRTVINYIAGIGAFFLVIALGLILWTVSLRKQVTLRTEKLEAEIQERRKTEDTLRESEDNYRNLFENANEAIYVAQDGKLVFLNLRTTIVFGYSGEELVSRPFIEFVHPDDRELVLDRHIRRMKGEELPHNYDFQIIHKDGNFRWVELNVVAINWKGRPATLNFLSDITDRKRAEAALLEINERLSMALDVGNLGVWEWYLKRDEVRLDDQFHAMLGYTPGELPNTLQDWLPYHHPEDIPVWMSKARAYLRGESPIYESEHRIRNKAGTWSWVFTRGKIVNITPAGSQEQFIGIAMNVTERRDAEEERKAHIRFLESLERVDQAIKQEVNVEKMLRNIVETVFSIFDCDRAWLVYPCDPDALSFRVPVEICRPEYPGANILDMDVPMSPDAAQNLREALESDDPVTYTSGTERPINKVTAEQFGVQSQMFVSIYPKLGKPWVFGMHQCSYPRIWTKEEKKLFKEISRRISDGLSNVLFLRKLQENEERYRTVIEESNDGIALLKGDRHIFVNRKMVEIFGYDRPEEIIGQPVAMITHPDDRERVMDIFRQGQKGEALPPRYEFLGQRKNGEFIHIEVSAAKTTYQGEVVSLAYLRDITDRKRADETLRRSQQHQKAILDNIPDIAWLKDKERRYIAVNEPFEKSCGVKPDDLVGKTDLDIWPRDLAERYGAEDKEVMESGKRKQVEESLTDNEGNAFWIETIKTPIYDEQGKVIGTAGIARDITGRKQAEEDKQKNFEQLRKALGSTIQAIATIVEMRDPYTAGHQHRVADLARSIASEMGLSKDQIDGIRTAGLIHDIGKISVPSEILIRPTKLTDLEFSLIKTHAQSGYDMLKDIEFPWPIARTVLEHHERMDGSGYPNALTGDEILLESRILMVADVVEAIASHRPYRPALGIEVALEEIEQHKGILYDLEVVEVCLRLFREKEYRFN